MIWFTSDTHFGHRNIAGEAVSNWKDGYRGFKDTEHMNEILMFEINTRVAENDILYHLGDFAMRDLERYRKWIVCKEIHLIKGNHDKIRPKHTKLFQSIQDYKEIEHNRTKIVLSHYAHRVWNKSHRGAVHLYGHSHGSIDDNWGKSMDVGVDAMYKRTGMYSPISLDEVWKIMEDREQKVVDHHE